MSEHIRLHFLRKRMMYLALLGIVAIGFGVVVSLFSIHNVSAIVTEVATLDVNNGATTMGATSTKELVRIMLTTDSAETLDAVKFTIQNVNGVDASDFASVSLVKPGLEPGQFITVTTTALVAVGSEMTLFVPNEPLLAPSTFFLRVGTSPSIEAGDQFRMVIDAGPDTYILNTGTVTASALTTGIVTIELTPPTATTGVPANNATNVPTVTFIEKTFSEVLSASSVSTSTVLLRANTGNTQLGAPAGTNYCESVSLDDTTTKIRCEHMSDQTPLATSTWYTLTITTGVKDANNNALASATTTVFQTGSFDAGTNMTPPVVESAIPENGTFSFPVNGNLYVQFPDGGQGNMSISGVGSVTSTNNIILKTAVNGQPTGDNIICSATCLTWNASTHRLKIDPTNNLAASTEYVLIVQNTVTNVSGASFGGQNSPPFFRMFKTSASAEGDSTAPTITFTEPAHGATGVQHNLPSVRVQFSESMDATLFTSTTAFVFYDASSPLNSIFDGGETKVSSATNFFYDEGQKSLFLGITTILGTGRTYCVFIDGDAGGVADSVGTVMLGDQTKCFTVAAGAFTATAPTVEYVDADSFMMWVQFSQPVDTTQVVTKANYAISSITGGVSSTVNTTNATFTYRPEANAVEIQGLGLAADTQFEVVVTGVTDMSDTETIVANGITNVGKGVVQDTNNTGGFVGGFEGKDFSQTNFATFWEKPERCFSRNFIAGATTELECEFPAPATLAAGSKFILTLPSGFGVGSAAIVPVSTSWMNKDLNGPAANAPVLSAIATNTISNTITLTTGNGGIASGDHVRFELSGIVNSSAPGEKTVSIVLKDANGVKQGQTITTQPFMIGEGGNRSISGTVCKGSGSAATCGESDTGISGAKIFCDSFGGFGAGAIMAGHQETTSDGSGNWTISSLSDGEYGCGIMPDPTTLNNLSGGSDFKKLFVSGANKTDVDFRFTDISSTGKTLSVTIASSNALNGEEVDIFCNAGSFDFNFSSPIMKVVTLDSNGATSTSMMLQPGKTYECGIGPHIDFSSMTNGGPPPVPVFNFMPPKPQQVVVPSDSNPTALTFNLVVAGNSITGFVKDSGGTGIANVFVHAAPMGCFDASTGEGKDCFGGFAQTKSDGSFTLKVAPGMYEVGADAPGMPPTESVSVTVTTNGTVLKNGTAVGETGLTLKMVKSSVTISGSIKDESGNGIKFAHVSAERIADGGTCSSFTPNGGFRDSPTDSSGSYTLYVSNGTWRVVAFSPSYGQVGCKIVTVSGGTSQTGQNIQATAGDFKTISGTAKAGAFISAFGPNGGNHTVADSSGNYSLKVTAGTYKVDCFAHGVGPCGFDDSVDASSADQTVDFNATVDTGTVSLTITGITDAFVDIRNSSGRGAGTGQNNNGVYTVVVPVGTYTVRAGGPKYGELCAGQSVTVTSGQTATVTCTPPSNVETVTGRVTDGTSNVAGATLKFINNSSKDSFIVTTNAVPGSSANVSAPGVPDGTYTVIASKQGYEPGSTTATVADGQVTVGTIAMTQASGANGTTVSTTVQADGSDYTGTAKVIATKSGKTVVADIDKTTGEASLPLTNGTWTVKAVGDNGKQSSETTVTVANGLLSGDAPTLSLSTAISGFTAVNENKTVSPKTGGLITADNVAGLEVNIPASTLHTTDSNTGKIEIKTDPTVAAIDPGEGLAFVGDTGYDITPKDSSGNTLGKTLYGDAVTITLPYTDAEVTAANVEESSLTIVSLNANGEFEAFPTVVDTVNNLLIAQVTHFSTFSKNGGTVASTPSTPSSPSTGGGGSSSIIPPTVPKAVEPTKSKTIDQAFEINSATTVVMGALSHTVTVSNALDAEATLIIASTPVTTTLAKGKTAEVDTNADGYTNIQVTYYGLDASGKPTFRFVTLSDEGERNNPMTINDGNYTTATTSVSLFLNATGATEMMISSSSAFSGASYSAYKATSTWTLSSGNGLKTVYVKLKSTSGGTVTISDTITVQGQGFEQKPEEIIKSEAKITCSLEIGKAYKTQNSSAVYYISKPFGGGTACVKRAFSKAEIFFSYFSAWSEVKIVSMSSLDAIPKDKLGFMPLGPKYSPKYGALIKSVDNPKVYLLVDGKKRWIDSEGTFSSFGYSWDWIEDVHEDLISGVSDGDAITTQTGYPSGILIKYAGNPKVYLLAPHKTKAGKLEKKHIKDMETFDTLGYRWDRIVSVPSSTVFEDGEQLVSVKKVKGLKVTGGYTFTHNLSVGSSNEEVKQLQIKLQELGFLSSDVKVTGYFGSATTVAVKKFQTAKGIQALGIVGPGTRSALNSL